MGGAVTCTGDDEIARRAEAQLLYAFGRVGDLADQTAVGARPENHAAVFRGGKHRAVTEQLGGFQARRDFVIETAQEPAAADINQGSPLTDPVSADDQQGAVALKG